MKKLLIIFHLAFLQVVGLQAQSGFTGFVVYDADNSCTFSSGDFFIADAIIEASDSLGNFHYYGNSALGTGAYQIETPPGTYVLSASLPFDNPYLAFCQNNLTRTISIGTDTVIFLAQPVIYCPLMYVDIGSDGIPFCGQTQYYVKYQNIGTVGGSGVYIDIELDSFTTLDSSSIPSISLGNNTYRFNIGYVGLGRDSMGLIHLDVTVCGVLAGQKHCAKAHIYPDVLCGNIWNDAILVAEAVPLGDSILFTVTNQGLTAMPTALTASIVEDDLMYSQPSVGPLNPSESDSILVATNSHSAYRLEFLQNTAIPKVIGSAIVWAAVEGSNPDTTGVFNIGNFTKFYTDNSAVSEAYDCQESSPQVIYNRKTMQTKGFKNQRYITRNTPLEYQVRFQNLTPSIGYFVDIYETLHSGIDINTLYIGAVSHPDYVVELLDNNLLHIHLPFINLQPNNLDSTRSHGFVNIHFDQKPNLPLGTVIENRAIIVINGYDTTYTANVFHTIGEDFIVFVSNEMVYQPQASVRVYPNPLTTFANFEVTGIEFENLELEIFSISGQLMSRSSSHFEDTLQWQRNDLPSGFYFYRLLADGQPVDSGKVLLR